MKAKLIKTENGYGLEGVEIVAFYSSKRPVHNHYKLSKQNCDEIFGVVDVEKLAEKLYPYHFGTEKRIAYKNGFKKAMELNEDKVFTEDDIRKVVNYMFEQTVVFSNKVSALDVNRYIQSIQQPTEIEVTFDPEEKDSEGCLILKKI